VTELLHEQDATATTIGELQVNTKPTHRIRGAIRTQTARLTTVTCR
jgi:hypothetical protein